MTLELIIIGILLLIAGFIFGFMVGFMINIDRKTKENKEW